MKIGLNSLKISDKLKPSSSKVLLILKEYSSLPSDILKASLNMQIALPFLTKSLAPLRESLIISVAFFSVFSVVFGFSSKSSVLEYKDLNSRLIKRSFTWLFKGKLTLISSVLNGIGEFTLMVASVLDRNANSLPFSIFSLSFPLSSSVCS